MTLAVLRHYTSHVPAITRDRLKSETHIKVNKVYWSIEFLFIGSLAN
jgi:hypothetical protein